eukprot:TRINITY_DN8927_c0_g1_i2.p1 TRINITY_DN8927_c0_g1~~TRINITY_DN8927_c0_g1_i2.p1  ORF type:complete len:139 (+),score=56.50 TRINITY_DN8927_c0_g1_i2:42-458(+)
MEAKLMFPLVAALVLMLVNMGSGLQCHQCTSKEDPDCADPFYHEDTKPAVKTTRFLKDCPADREYTLCRKIYQNVRGESRVIRSCGWEESDKECYSTVLEEYNTYVCQCKEDGCNSASMLSLSAAGILSTISLAYLLN